MRGTRRANFIKNALRLQMALLMGTTGMNHAAAQEPARTVYAAGKGLDFQAMLDDLSRADIVFVGENHNHAAGHRLEIALLQGLFERRPDLALGLEMFERDTQIVLDEYLAGYLTDSSFTQSSRPWPNYKTDYAPLVLFCKEHKLPVLATNAPRRYVNMVSREGQASLLALPKNAHVFLPPLPYSMALPSEYDRQLTEIFSGGHDDKNPAMPAPERMKQAQGLWDATMADSIAGFRRRSRRLVMHVNGAMHSDSGYGIAARLRVLNPRLRVKIVTIRPAASYPAPPPELPATAADYVIVTPPDAAPAAPSGAK